MTHPELKITVFEPVEDGFLLAFAAAGSDFVMAIHAIVALDPWHRRWIAEECVWWIADDAITHLARRMPALAEALREWHQRSDELIDFDAGSYATSRAWRRGTVFVPPAVKTAYSHLHLPSGASAEAVAAARRTLARQHHPDAGGEHTSMVTVNRAADTVMQWLKRR